VTVSVKTPPPVEPVTLAEARNHCRLVATGSPDTHPDDDFLTRVIAAARQHAERWTRRTFVETEFTWSFDSFPNGRLVLPRDPVLSITSIAYTDTSGNPQTFSDYTTQFTESESVIVPNYGSDWPTARGHLGDVTVTFKAGYAPETSPTDYRANVPASIKSAILLLVGHLYEHRSAVITDATVADVKLAYESLLWPHRILDV